jgi:short subunit dehydrogenase-like uncharacterized protein
MIDRHHEAAVATGARIVHFCGFDSIPSDLGVFLLQHEAAARFERPLASVATFVGPMRGGFSGGTVATMAAFVEAAKHDRSLRRVAADPYALNPDGERNGPDGRDDFGVAHDEWIDAWTAPFLMASVNSRVVRRSNALLDYRYGRDFRYREVSRCGAGAKGLVEATATVAALGGLMAGLAAKPSRALLRRFVLPAPGEGPSAESRARGFFRFTLVGRNDAHDELRVRVAGDQDPGYGETAKMLAESALCLALDGAELEAGGGILTPASCMGMQLVERLRSAGMTLSVQ